MHPRAAGDAEEGEKQAASPDDIAAVAIPLSLDRFGRRLHRELAVGLDRARTATRRSGATDRARATIRIRSPARSSWLRAYSNYLTPKLGLFSADTWTAVALYVRNLVLNWLVILPALCLLLLAIKAFAVVGFWSRGRCDQFRPLAVIVAFVLLGVILLMYALHFALQNRPSALPRPARGAAQAQARLPANKIAYRNETGARRRRAPTKPPSSSAACLPALAAALSALALSRGPGPEAHRLVAGPDAWLSPLLARRGDLRIVLDLGLAARQASHDLGRKNRRASTGCAISLPGRSPVRSMAR